MSCDELDVKLWDVTFKLRSLACSSLPQVAWHGTPRRPHLSVVIARPTGHLHAWLSHRTVRVACGRSARPTHSADSGCQQY